MLYRLSIVWFQPSVGSSWLALAFAADGIKLFLDVVLLSVHFGELVDSTLSKIGLPSPYHVS